MSLAAGTKLGPYEITTPLGSGGMPAWNPRAVSSLNHPHICTLHDVGREGDIDMNWATRARKP